MVQVAIRVPTLPVSRSIQGKILFNPINPAKILVQTVLKAFRGTVIGIVCIAAAPFTFCNFAASILSDVIYVFFSKK
jgi:hypothetical protein